MRKLGTFGLTVAILAACLTVTLQADVKMEEKSQVKFAGMLGKMMGLLGGKAMKEGIVSTVSIKGDRQMTVTSETAQIVDLNEEKLYDLDLKKKTYTVTTFAELRRRLQEAADKAEKDAQKAREKDKNAKEMEIDFKVNETGQKKTISGFDCREVVMTITVREKGKTLEEAGGLVLTANNWLTSGAPAAKEAMDFNKRYAEKLAGVGPAGSAEAMAQAMTMYPGLKDAMVKMQAENVNMDGTPIQTIMTMESVPSKEMAQQQQKREKDESESSGGGGLLGGFAKRLGKKKSDDQPAAGSEKPNAFMTMNHDILSISTGVAPEDVSIPAGFKQKN